MQVSRVVCASLVAIGALVAPPAVAAQENAQGLQAQIDQLKRDFDALAREYRDRLTGLETRLAALEGTREQPTPVPPSAATATPTPNNPSPPATPEPAQAAAAPPASTAQVPPGAEGAGGPSGQLPIYGAAVSGSKVFNPDIAVIG